MTKPVAKSTPSANNTKSAKMLPSGMVGTTQQNHDSTTANLFAAPKRKAKEPTNKPGKFHKQDAGSTLEQSPASHTPTVTTGSGRVRVEGKPHA